jgi:arginase
LWQIRWSGKAFLLAGAGPGEWTGQVADAALERITRPEVDGIWVHMDADVLDPSVLPSVDSPEPGGLELDELTEVLTPLLGRVLGP